MGKQLKKSKKPNPKKKPATQADVKKAKSQVETRVIKLAWAIMFSVLADKEGMSDEDLQRIWKEVEDLSGSISKGYVNLSEFQKDMSTFQIFGTH